jgi:predicted metal-dependent HD superfamily phosphohydrolase
MAAAPWKPGRFGIEGVFNFCWLHPGYWKTLAHLRPRDPDVSFDGSALRFERYPFQPASVFPAGRVQPDQVAEVNLSVVGQVRLKNGDILFVPHSGKAALMAFINRSDVPVRNRGCIWGALLTPFLDTSEEQGSIDGQLAWLAELGLDRAAVRAWQREVTVSMIAYNFGTHLWEFRGFDLYDVLFAQQARLSQRKFADFYSRAMRLAAADPESEPWNPESKDIGSALHSVLVQWYPQEKDWDRRRQEMEKLVQRLAQDLTAAYSQPHRRYHSQAHIEKCLLEFGGAWTHAVEINEVRWALLFHDAIYDPRRQDNEARSADWACSIMAELKRPEDQIARIRGMILATAHTGEPRTPDEALLLDIDLSILGSDPATFDEYDRGIREEYSWVPEERYRQERAKVLASFLARTHIYQTPPYRRRCESRARANLERALAAIER